MIRFTLSLVCGLERHTGSNAAVPHRHPLACVRFRKRFFAALGCLALCAFNFASHAALLELRRTIQVDGAGVFVRDLFIGGESNSLAGVQLAPAPAVGRALIWDAAQIKALLADKAGLTDATNLSGADRVTVTRRTRTLEDAELKELLQAALQRDHVKDRGELELRFGRPWNPVVIPDEPVTVRILDVPSTGLSASFVCRFEVRCSDVRFTEAQSLVQAKIWRDVLVSSGPVRRGSPLRDAEVKPERRDVLAQRDFVPARMLDDGDLELTENLAAGVVLTGRSVRLRPAILRGTMVEAWIHDGGMQISLKVEALEDGVVGQTLRVRNPKTKRELLGKVHNEQTVILHL